MSVELSIYTALLQHVASLGLSVPIAWPNVSFAPPSDGRHVAVFFIPNGATRIAIPGGAPHRYIGMLQVSVFWPRDRGEKDAIELAGQIAQQFPDDLKLTDGGVSLRVMNRPSMGGAITDDVSLQIPLTVEWEAYA